MSEQEPVMLWAIEEMPGWGVRQVPCYPLNRIDHFQRVRWDRVEDIKAPVYWTDGLSKPYAFVTLHNEVFETELEAVEEQIRHMEPSYNYFANGLARLYERRKAAQEQAKK